MQYKHYNHLCKKAHSDGDMKQTEVLFLLMMIMVLAINDILC